MKSIKRKSQTNILDSHGNKLYFVGIDAFMTSGGSPCVILATDINDQRTFSRYTMDFMEICGYAI